MRHLKLSLQKRLAYSKQSDDESNVLNQYRRMLKNYDEESSDDDDNLVGDQSPSIGLAIDKRLRSKKLLINPSKGEESKQ